MSPEHILANGDRDLPASRAIATDARVILSMPWSLRIVFLLVLASAGAFVASKRPFVSDAEKICNVAGLSACPERDGSLVSNNCKIAWLEHSLWSFGRLAQFPRGGGPDGGEFLRSLAREAGLAACPEADAVDREFAHQQPAAAAEVTAGQPEPPSDSAGPAKGPTAERPTGIVKCQAPMVVGPLDPAVVSREVRTRSAVFKACYQRALKREPNLAGKVKLHWTITSAGTVSDVNVEEDDLGAPDVITCIQAAVRRSRFPPPSGGSVDVVYPFVFERSREVIP